MRSLATRDTEAEADTEADTDTGTGSGTGTGTGSGTTAPVRRERRWVTALPVILVLVAVAVLTTLNLNGSSVHQLADPGRDDPALVFGHPRGIRADEWALSTPNLVGNVRRGLPTRPWIGLTPTFLPATSIGVASAHWTEIFKPYDWGLFVLPLDKGFALRWWGLLALGLLGAYPLLWQLTRSMVTAGGLTALAVLTPATAWWSLTPAAVLGLLAGAAACMVAAAGTRRVVSALVWGLGAGYLGVAAFLVLYPPWLLPIGFVAMAVVLGRWLDLRARPSRIGASVGGALLVAVPALALWYAQSRETIRVIAQTYYPGRRISEAAGSNLAWLLDAPSSLWLSAFPRPSTLDRTARSPDRELTPANASEVASAWLPLPVLIAVALILVWAVLRHRRERKSGTEPGGIPAGETVDPLRPRRASLLRPRRTDPARPRRTDPVRPRWTVLAVLVVTGLLLAWALLPLPDAVGGPTLLDRVPGRRIPPALGLATAVLLAGGGMLLHRRAVPRWLFVLPWLGGIATVALTVWAVEALPWEHRAPGTVEIAAVSAVLGLGAALVATGRLMRMAATLLAALAIGVFAPVNPIYRGLGPLEHDPLVTTLRTYTQDGRAPRAVVYGGLHTNALVTASGVSNLSGLTAYPDATVWNRLAPDQEPEWNNFAKFFWRVAPDVDSVRIHAPGGTSMHLLVNPCSAAVRSLDTDLTVSETKITLPCLRLDRVVYRGDTPVYLYRPAAEARTGT